MGGRIADRLLQGNQVYGTNRTASKAGALIERMLTEAAELGYAHRDIAALFQVLARTQAAPPQVTGPDTAAAGAGSGRTAA